MSTFHDLSPEAAILFIIAEPLRRVPDLTFDDWTKQAFQIWIGVTALGFDEFWKAFGEVSDWLNSKRN